MTDPLEALTRPHEPLAPRAAFASRLRARLVAELGLDPASSVPTVHLPERKSAMTPTPTPTTTTSTAAPAETPAADEPTAETPVPEAADTATTES